MEQGNIQSRPIGAAETTALSASPGLWECIIGSGVARVGGAALVLILQIYQGSIGVPPQIIGLVSVAFYLTELTGAPLFGSWVDRRGWRPFLLLGALLSAAAAMLTWVTTLMALPLALPVLIAARLLLGAGIASNVPATLSFISAASGHNAERRARAVSWFELATIGGTALGGVLGAMLYNTLSTTSFIAVAVLYLLCMVVLLRVPARLPDMPEHGSGHSSLLGLLRRRDLWSFAPAWVAVNAILGVWLNNFASMLTQPCANPPTSQTAELCTRLSGQLLVGDFSPTTAGAIFGSFAVLFSVGIVLWSRILPGMRQSRAMLISLTGALATCGLVALVNHLGEGQTLLVGILSLLIAAALMVLSGFTPAALSMLVDLAERRAEDRGSTMGIYSVLLGVGQFLGGALGGIFASWLGVDGLVLLTLIWTVIAAGCVVFFGRVEKA
ncbi:MAG TPA: MFS transporter [Roseiflexaceae bacterium]|nr:MFS transporter [Roseiflexaceae bacterium]